MEIRQKKNGNQLRWNIDTLLTVKFQQKKQLEIKH